MSQKLCFGDGYAQRQHAVDVELFGSDARRDDGLNVYCKKCAAARQKRWKQSNPLKVQNMKRAYRLSQKRVAVA